jgi:hypothetical protein
MASGMPAQELGRPRAAQLEANEHRFAHEIDLAAKNGCVEAMEWAGIRGEP